MMCIERSLIYTKGQNVQINVGSSKAPRWVDGKVIDHAPETENRLRRTLEKVSGLKPIIVEVDEPDNRYYGAKIKKYGGASRIRPNSVR
jgi:hypothetical protein